VVSAPDDTRKRLTSGLYQKTDSLLSVVEDLERGEVIILYPALLFQGMILAGSPALKKHL